MRKADIKDVVFLLVVFPLTLPFLVVGFLAGFMYWSLAAGWLWAGTLMESLTKRGRRYE